MANGRRDFSRNKLVENRISVITAQQKHGPATSRLRQVRPPDFVLLHGFHSSALDQSSASSAESDGTSQDDGRFSFVPHRS